MKQIERLTKLDFNREGVQVPSSVKNVGLDLMDTPSDFNNGEIKRLLRKPSELYQNFDNWYCKSSRDALKSNFFFDEELRRGITNFSKEKNNIPGLERYFLVLSIDDVPAGISILKNTYDEKKISTFTLEEKYKNAGLASYLMSRSLDFLGKSDVSITVNEDVLDELYPFLTKKGFVVDKKVLGEYWKNKNEYHFLKLK